MATKSRTKVTGTTRAKRKNVAHEFMEAMGEAVAIAEGRAPAARVHVEFRPPTRTSKVDPSRQ